MPSTRPGSSPIDSTLGQNGARDTSRLFYVLANRPEVAYTDGDSLLTRSFYIVDPARLEAVEYATLGNTGSSTRPLLFSTSWRQGFDVGANQVFDLYKIHSGQQRHYRSGGAFSDLQYSQGRNQNESTFRGRFARTFTDSISFSLEYKGINHLGQFQHQRVKHNAISAGVWIPKKKRWQGFLNYTQNVFRQQENGGLNDTITGLGTDFLSDPIGLATNLGDNTALSRVSNWSIQGFQHLDLLGREGGRRLALVHEVEYEKARFKMIDEAPSGRTPEDSLFLGAKFYTDSRGIRHHWNTQKVENRLLLRTFKTKNDAGEGDELSAGLEHGYWTVIHDLSQKNRFHQFFLVGNLALKWRKTLSLEGRAAIGLLENTRQYNAEARLGWTIGKIGILEGHLLNQNVQPRQIFQQLFVSGREVWNNQFSNINETTLAGTLRIPRIGLSATLQNHLLVNYLYINSDQDPVQVAGSIGITQLLLEENFRVRKFGFENILALQAASQSAIIKLPSWYYRGGLFFETPAFKKRMLLRAGTEWKANAPFAGDGYNPVLWQFYRQDDKILPSYWWGDVYLALKIKEFRFLAKYENLGQAIWTNQFAFQTHRYAQLPPQMRISVAWRFRDK